MNQPLPFSLHVRFSLDQRQLLEEAARSLDTTLSGAVRHFLDAELDRPVNDDVTAPTRRELMREDDGVVVIAGQRMTVERIERAEA